MNGESINAIVRCAFKICLIYFLKCFLPSVKIGAYSGLCSSNDYDKELKNQITDMSHFFVQNSITDMNSDYEVEQKQKKRNSKRNSKRNNKHNNKYDDYDECDKTEDYTKTTNHDEELKKSAIKEIQQNITNQLKEKYGDDICIDFAHNEPDNKERKSLYALKIKEIGRREPKDRYFSDSDIYVNTETKQFYIKTDDGFHVYPLVKRSIVRCDRNGI